MKGRKPVPTAIKLVKGNPGKSPLPKNEPKPTKKTTPPKHLDQYAKTEWRRISKQLENLGLLTVCDRAALACYCQAYSRWRHAEEGL